MPWRKIYKFKGIDHLYADEKGNFFYKDRPVPKVVNNGSLAVRVGAIRYGIKKLRVRAYACRVAVDECPF